MLEEEPEDGRVPQLGHREEADLAMRAFAQPQHDDGVEERDVVAREQDRALARNAARADAADVEERTDRVRDDPCEPVDRLDRRRSQATRELLTRS